MLLGTNVSFLSIQSVDTAGSEGRFRTNAQRASYFSILASMGTIVFSLLLLRQHREAISVRTFPRSSKLSGSISYHGNLF